jgi:NAD(P)-dependent dehydrogenase (short-subunit alcohol dehydrogenase family)
MTKSFDPQSDFSLRGKTALVTGGGKGIGQGVAIGLARSGADIHILDKDLAAAETTVKLLKDDGHHATAHHVDVTDESAIDQVMAKIAAQTSIDLLVNNAGLAIRKASVDLPLAEWDAVPRGI